MSLSERVVAADASRCSICYDSYEGRRTEPLRPCGHSEFCAPCVDEWVRHQVEVLQEEPTCSYCRTPITSIGARILRHWVALETAISRLDVAAVREIAPVLGVIPGTFGPDYNHWRECFLSICGLTPITIAEREQQREIISLLLQRLHDSGSDQGPYCLMDSAQEAMHVLVEQDRLDLLRLFVLVRPSLGSSAYERALYRGRLDMIEFLLAHASLDQKQRFLRRAAASGREAVVRLLLSPPWIIELKAAPDQSFLWNCLKEAASHDFVPIAELLSQQVEGCSPPLGWNCGDIAFDAIKKIAARGNLNLLRLFLSDFSKPSDDRSTVALISAAKNGQVHVMEFLLPHTNAAARWAGLSEASASGREAAVQFLLSSRSVQDRDVVSNAFKQAAASGHLNIVQLLLPRVSLYWSSGERGASADRLEAIRLAGERGHLPVVRFLMEHTSGGFATTATSRLQSAIFYNIAVHGRGRDIPEMIQYLLERNFVPCIDSGSLAGATRSFRSGRSVDETREVVRVLLSSPKLSITRLTQAYIASLWHDPDQPFAVDLGSKMLIRKELWRRISPMVAVASTALLVAIAYLWRTRMLCDHPQ